MATAMCEQFNSGPQKKRSICYFPPSKMSSALEHPHFTYLPVPTETATLPPPEVAMSTLVSRSEGCNPLS